MHVNIGDMVRTRAALIERDTGKTVPAGQLGYIEGLGMHAVKVRFPRGSVFIDYDQLSNALLPAPRFS